MQTTATPERAILILGATDPSEAALADAAGYAEVFVLARAVPDGDSPYLIDAGRAEANAERRLRRATTDLRLRGSEASGLVGDPDLEAARRDAVALFPQPSVLLEAA